MTIARIMNKIPSNVKEINEFLFFKHEKRHNLNLSYNKNNKVWKCQYGKALFIPTFVDKTLLKVLKQVDNFFNKNSIRGRKCQKIK